MSCYYQERISRLTVNFKIILFVSDEDGAEYDNLIKEHWKEIEHEKEFINYENIDYRNQEIINQLIKKIKLEEDDVEAIVISNRVNLRKLKKLFRPNQIVDVEHGISDLIFWLKRVNLIKNKGVMDFFRVSQIWTYCTWPAKQHLTLVNKSKISDPNIYNLNVELFKNKLQSHSRKYSTENFEIVILIERLDVYGKVKAKEYIEKIIHSINLDLRSKNATHCNVLIKQRYGSVIKVKAFKDIIEQILYEYSIYFAIDFAPENIPAEYLIFNNNLKYLYAVGISTALNLNALKVEFKNIIYIDTHLSASTSILNNQSELLPQFKEKKINERIFEIENSLAQITESI